MYLEEIASMMHTFGDVKEPKRKSVQLMHSILHDQMKLLLLEAEKIACFRGSPEISHKDILFLMRRNKMKLKRLIEYLQVLELSQTLNKHLKDEEVTRGDLKLRGKKVKKCLDFLSSIEDCDEFTSVMEDETIMDNTTIKRKMRRYWMTFKMSSNEYDEFSKTSRASFCPLQKFKWWLLKDKVICFGLTDSAVRIIDFLARETIAEIVDMVLILKMKKLGKYQPLYYHTFVYSVQSKSSLKTSDILEQSDGKDDLEKDCSTSSASSSASSPCKRDSRINCKKNDISFFKMNDNIHEINLEKSDPLSHNLSRKSQLDEHILQRGTIEYELILDFLESGADSKVKLNECYETIDEPEAPCMKVDLNETSSDSESNSVPSNIEKSSENAFSNRKESQLYDLRDTSGGGITYIQKTALTNRSNDINEKIIPSDMSDTDLYSILDDCHNSYDPTDHLVSSTRSLQGTPIAGASYQSQESNLQIEDISDTSDHEIFPYEAMLSCDHKKPLKRKICPNMHSKKIVQEESIGSSSAIKNHLSLAAQNEVKFITEPIEPAEIKEAFANFQEPSPMVLIFATDHIPRKTKLICLAESSSLNIF